MTYLIKIDIDRKRIPSLTADYITHLAVHLQFRKIKIERSKSGGYHIWITLKHPLNDDKAILIQALCGSDIKRERMNFHRLLHGGKLDNWNILFSNMKVNGEKYKGGKRYGIR